MKLSNPDKSSYNKQVSVVIGSFNRCRFLKLAIASVRTELKRMAIPAEIIIIDGGSTDGTLKWLTKQKDIITIVQHNRGTWCNRAVEYRSWGYFMNLGFKCAQGKYVCMLSDDCLLLPGAIENGVELFEKKLAVGEKVGAVAFYWRNWPEQEKYWVGLTLGDKMFVNHGLYLRTALEEVAYIDEETYQFYQADGDLCLKLWHNGYSCIDSPGSFVEHYSHANPEIKETNLEKQQKDKAAYLVKWEGLFYSPEANNTGGWITKEFIDPTSTAINFMRADFINWFIKGKILKYKYLQKLH